MGHRKTKVYATKPNDSKGLRERILQECWLKIPHMLQAVRGNCDSHLFYHCMEVSGCHFGNVFKSLCKLLD